MKGANMQERKFPIREFPVRLQLNKSGDQVRAAWSVDGVRWISGGTHTFDWLAGECYVGLAVLSHDDRYLARGAFRNIRLSKTVPLEPEPEAEPAPEAAPAAEEVSSQVAP